MALKRSYKKGIGRIYIDDEGRELPSVTTVLNSTIAKGPWLENWRQRLQRSHFHTRLEIEALKGLTSEATYDIFDDALKTPEEYRDAAGAVGTFYHAAIEAYLTDKPINSFIEQDPRAADVIASLAKWETEKKLEPIKTEYFISSPRWGFAGTIDLVAHQTTEHGKQLVLADFKTGSLNSDALLQLAAYSVAYQEQHGERPQLAFFVKIDVEKARVTEAMHIHFHEISQLFDVWLDVLRVWRWRTLKEF